VNQIERQYAVILGNLGNTKDRYRFDQILEANREEIDTLVSAGDAVRTSRFLRKVLLA